MPVRRRKRPLSCLSSREQQDFDGLIFAALYEHWARWQARATAAKRSGKRVPAPPCLIPGSFARLIPRACSRDEAEREVDAAFQRLRGHRLLRSVPNTWAPGGGRPASCLVPQRAGIGAVGGRRRLPVRN